MKTKKANKEYLVVVSYALSFYLDNELGINHMDSVISNALNKQKTGSGAGFDRRDLDFFYKTVVSAKSAVAKIKKMSKMKKYKDWKISVCLSSY